MRPSAMTMMTRRRFLVGAGVAALSVFVRPPPTFAAAPTRLTTGTFETALLGDGEPKTPVWGYNGRVPGPELRAVQGTRMRVDLHNGLDQATTIHWHGLRVPNGMDGVPGLTQPLVEAGGRFAYDFDLHDAGTYWYHPHFRTHEQIDRGLQGVLIVDEPEPPRVDRDVVWVIDDWRIGKDGRITEDFGQMHDMTHAGRLGNVASLNGRDSGAFALRAGERLRLRLLNTANARIFALTFEGHDPQVIAYDGQPVAPHAPEGGRVVLASGQRVDLILDAAGKPGGRYAVTDSYYSRQSYTFLQLAYSAEAPLRASPLAAPLALAPNPIPALDRANAIRHEVALQGGAMGQMRSATYKGETVDIRGLVGQGKAWAINGVAADSMTMPAMFRFARGRTHILKVVNETAWPHPMHLHGHTMTILSRNGAAPPREVRRDTVLFAPRETVELGFVADNPGKWLFHCHILEHHLAGMGSVAEVI